ncbi:MAG: hypothetical protein K8R28_05535 [Desulfobacterales bacterium]|nr:hypothetical protein [Desulfobacterales bacterium]
MKISAVCYVTRGVVRSHDVLETIVIVIVTIVIALVVPANVGSADNALSRHIHRSRV